MWVFYISALELQLQGGFFIVWTLPKYNDSISRVSNCILCVSLAYYHSQCVQYTVLLNWYSVVEHKFDIAVYTKGVCIMTENELKLLRMIREHDDPEQALVIALEVITSFLGQHGSSEEPDAVCPQELDETD